MHYRADVSEPDPIIISKYLSEPGPTGSDGLGSGIHPIVGIQACPDLEQGSWHRISFSVWLESGGFCDEYCAQLAWYLLLSFKLYG